MNTTKKITLSAVMAALATVLMLVSYFPYLTYAVPAMACLCIMVIVIEINCKWAFLTYFSAAFLSFLFAESESKFMFIGFFGFYPIIKCLVEKINRPVIEWFIKLIVFNLCIIAIYTLIAKAFMLSFDDLGKLASYGESILLVAGNIVFVVYDIAVSRMAWFYSDRIQSKILKIFK